MLKYQSGKIKFNLSGDRSLRKFFVFLLVFVSIAGGAYIYHQGFFAKGASYGWLQTDWLASTTAKASHLTDQSGWTQFYSKDTLVSTSTPGQLTLSSATSSTIDTATADFSAGTLSNTYATSGAVYLKKPNGVACTADSQWAGGWCGALGCGTCAGYKAPSGYCLYMGNYGQSCTTVCSTHGGSAGRYNSSASAIYSDIMYAVGEIHWGGAALDNGSVYPGDYNGSDFCFYRNNTSWSESATDGNVRRLCACNN